MEKMTNKPDFCNAFRLSIVKDMAIFDFGFASSEKDTLTDSDVQKVSSIAMQAGLLEVMRKKIDEVIGESKK